jgi:hypothetical protein
MIYTSSGKGSLFGMVIGRKNEMEARFFTRYNLIEYQVIGFSERRHGVEWGNLCLKVYSYWNMFSRSWPTSHSCPDFYLYLLIRLSW